jgi:hypothetical protein
MARASQTMTTPADQQPQEQEATVILGEVYRSVAGTPNVRTAERLDCRNYGIEFHQALLRYEGRSVRITIEAVWP